MAWFTFTDASEELFLIRIEDPATVAHARALLAGTVTSAPLIAGTVVTEPAPYNIGWSYHLDPDSISFFEVSFEVGDATMRYIEDHVDEVGGAFLPGSRWTPWSSALVGELQPRFGGKEDDVMLGSRAADLLFGRAGDDCLIGAVGNDHLVAGAGADTGFGRAGDDKLGGGWGRDTLGGGLGKDVLAGDGGADQLRGGLGDDSLLGGDGWDMLTGGAGNDTVEGGNGRDLLTGGAGADDFKFSAVGQSGPAAAKRDVIADFKSGLDRIDLSVIDTNPAMDDDQSFAFIGTAEFSAPGQVRFETVGGFTTVFVNTDRDSDFEMAIEVLGPVSFTGSDLVL